MPNAKALGTRREHAVKRLLEADGWVVCRPGSSLGAADLWALKVGECARMIQVKGNKSGGPYSNFRPAERNRLINVAARAGAVAELAHWPVRGECRFYPSSSWPHH